jgi:hypothetical protein
MFRIKSSKILTKGERAVTYRDIVEMQFKSHLRMALQIMGLPADLMEEIIEAPDEERERWLNQLVKEDMTDFIDWAIDVTNVPNPEDRRTAWVGGLEVLKAVREKRLQGLKRAKLAGG